MANSKTQKKTRNTTTTSPAEEVTEKESTQVQQVTLPEKQSRSKKQVKTQVEQQVEQQAVETTADVATNNATDNATDKKMRYFKCIWINTENNELEFGGRYSGRKPKQAASKACTRLYKNYEADERPEKIIFGMHECTRSCKNKKKFFYVGSKELLKVPESVPIFEKVFDKNKKPVWEKTSKGEIKMNKLGRPMQKKQPKMVQKKDDKGNDVFDQKGNPVMVQLVIPYNFTNVVKKLQDVDEHPEYQRLLNYDFKETDEDETQQKTVKSNSASKKSKSASKKRSNGKSKATKSSAKSSKNTKSPATKASKSPSKSTKNTKSQPAKKTSAPTPTKQTNKKTVNASEKAQSSSKTNAKSAVSRTRSSNK